MIPATKNPGVTQAQLDEAMARVVTTPGPKGDKGDRGEQGVQGIAGIQGLKGDKGDAGEKGEKGERGEQGATGDRGLQGLQGIQGVQGAKGDTGPKGDPGTAARLVQAATITTNAAGQFTWTYPTPFSAPPTVTATVHASSDVYDVKITSRTATSCSIQIGRTQVAVVALLGLSILSVPSSVGATTVCLIASES